jgi:hypothetical protein
MGKTGTMAVEELFRSSRFVSPNAVLTTKKPPGDDCLQEVSYFYLWLIFIVLRKTLDARPG